MCCILSKYLQEIILQYIFGLSIFAQAALYRRGMIMPSSYKSFERKDLQTFQFDAFFAQRCNRTHDHFSTKQIWNHSDICSNEPNSTELNGWINFTEVGQFRFDDFKMYPPRHLRQTHQHQWVEEHSVHYLEIPQSFCFFKTAGWFMGNGAMFDCNNQYPLLTKQERKDLSLIVETEKISRRSKCRFHGELLFSALIPFNDAFSHSFSTGVSLIAYMLPLMANTSAKILVPSTGPFMSLLETLGVPSDRIVPVSSRNNELLHFSDGASLVLRQPPFNIIQAHWPANALQDMRNVTVSWLKSNGYLSERRQTYVVYLWRTGTRSVAGQQALVDRIKR